MAYKIDKKTERRLARMLGEMNLPEHVLLGIKTDRKLRNRLLEMQAIYDTEKVSRDKAYKEYVSHKLTMSVLIEGAESFSRPTLYADPLLKQYAEFLVAKSNEKDSFEKMQRALADKQAVESYNEALVSDILELMHCQKECTQLAGQVERQKQIIAELEDKLGVKGNVIPMERRVTTPPNNLDGVFPIDLHRD